MAVQCLLRFFYCVLLYFRSFGCLCDGLFGLFVLCAGLAFVVCALVVVFVLFICCSIVCLAVLLGLAVSLKSSVACLLA